jgi:hypothetical protein
MCGIFILFETLRRLPESFSHVHEVAIEVTGAEDMRVEGYLWNQLYCFRGLQGTLPDRLKFPECTLVPTFVLCPLQNAGRTLFLRPVNKKTRSLKSIHVCWS